MTPYAYQPLTRPHETRVLIIQPGSGKEELVCNLSHIEVGSGEPYEALSYCWSKSVAHQLDLDEVISLQDDDPGKEPRVTAVRDLLDDPEAGYIYIKYGGPIPDGKIVCDGVEIPVGGELLRALTHMREAHLHYPHVPGDRSPLRIWVDAICINQADIQERTEHVKMMGSVYEHASVVRIWVGDEIGLERNLYQAFDDLRTIFTELKPKLEQQKTPRDAQALCLAHPKWYSVEWLTIAHFLDRAWFERIWVVQEIANAKTATIQIGRYRIPWLVLETMLDNLGSCRLGDTIPHNAGTLAATSMGNLRRIKESGGCVSEADLLSVLEHLRNLKSTIPSDKIYGLLGILDPAISIEVDYSKSAESLFTDLAVHYLEIGYTKMLYHCGEPHQPTSLRLPSWVPDWTRQRWTSPLKDRTLPARAAGDTKTQLVIDTAAGLIRVLGRVVDEIAIVNDEAEIPVTRYEPDDRTAYDPAQNPKEKTKAKMKREQRRMRDGYEQMVRLAWPSRWDFTWEKYENLWRTFICNRFSDGSEPLSTLDYGMVWEDHMDWIFHHTANEGDEEDGPYYKEVVPIDGIGLMRRQMFKSTLGGFYTDKFASAHKRWCYNRRFFVSDAERYGWAVDGTKSGDLVVVLYGCAYPFLLRDAGDSSYKIIGDCYIHGLMDGEALADEFEEREFIVS